MSSEQPIKINTPILSLSEVSAMNLTTAAAKKLATAVATNSNKTDLGDATVEDLLNYFPMRYEDRSNFMGIDQLSPDSEAAVELFVRVSGGFRVGKNRPAKAPPLYIFEISGGDAERTRKPVVVWWFVSGKAAHNIVNYQQKRFTRGTRFIAYGKWEWDSRRNTYALRLNKPDELEILPNVEDPETFGLLKNLLNDDEKNIKKQNRR